MGWGAVDCGRRGVKVGRSGVGNEDTLVSRLMCVVAAIGRCSTNNNVYINTINEKALNTTVNLIKLVIFTIQDFNVNENM